MSVIETIRLRLHEEDEVVVYWNEEKTLAYPINLNGNGAVRES
jgi:hypothetical protein